MRAVSLARSWSPPGVAKVRATPRVSINKLGEYLKAGPARRRKIVQDQKRPPTFQVIRYTEAESAIVESLLADDVTVLDDAVDALQSTTPISKYDDQRITLCIEAIEAFRRIDLSGLGIPTFVHPSPAPATLSIAGVEVSVRPSVAARLKTRNGARLGLGKVYISKSFELDDDAGEYVAAVMRHFADVHYGTTDHRKVFVIDVFAGRVFVAPKAITRRMEDVEAACEEIAARWGTT